MIDELVGAFFDIVRFVTSRRRRRRLVVWLATLSFVGMVVYTFLFAPPSAFPDTKLLRIKKGSTLEQVALQLRDQHLINYAFLFEAIVRVHRNDGSIVAGEYSFTNPQNILTVARRLSQGDFELAPVKVRVQDGMNSMQITELLKRELPDFDADAFYALAQKEEGKLFPDTYFFFPGDDPELVLETMTDNFASHIHEASVANAITVFGKSPNEVFTMASLLEREAAETQDRRIIAGILWNRISIGMPLQVDAVFPYINGKNTFTLTRADLRIDSPYNTYVNKGLPPGPIASPSVDAIVAAVTPIKTNYLYYLSGRDGRMYYSATYEQHLQKKRKYLD